MELLWHQQAAEIWIFSFLSCFFFPPPAFTMQVLGAAMSQSLRDGLLVPGCHPEGKGTVLGVPGTYWMGRIRKRDGSGQEIRRRLYL